MMMRAEIEDDRDDDADDVDGDDCDGGDDDDHGDGDDDGDHTAIHNQLFSKWKKALASSGRPRKAITA